MKVFLTAVAVIAVANLAEVSGLFQSCGDPAVLIKWGLLDGFTSVPLTSTAASSKGYVETEDVAVPAPYDELIVMRNDNQFQYLVLPMYDNASTYIAGLKICLSKKTFTPYFDMEASGWVSSTMNETDYWCIFQFYLGEDYMNLSSAERISSYDTTKILQNDVLILSSPDGLMDVPANASRVTTDTKFTEQNFVPTMGKHYFYDISNTTKEGPVGPYFVLSAEKKVMGCGMVTFGTDNSTSSNLESPGAAAVKYIVTNGPDWMYNKGDLAATLHFFLCQHPRKMLFQ